MAGLLYMRAGELLMTRSLREGRVVLGRGEQAEFMFPDRAVSRLQCEIVPRGEAWALVDLSGRGTSVSHRVAGPNGTQLRDGDEIRLGDYSVVFSATDPGAPGLPTTPNRSGRGRTGLLEGRAPSHRARLRVRGPDGEQSIPLRPEEGFSLRVGADPSGAVQLQVKDQYASADHFVIAYTRGAWRLTDLGSKNGTWVGDLCVSDCLLPRQASLRAGQTTLFFEQDVATPDDEVLPEPLPGLVSRDPVMAPAIDAVRRYAGSMATVCVHGESGTGKDVIARAVHLLSERREAAYVAINCGALPKETIESTLFGHEKGAFTGADRVHEGLFEQANGGTLFLDEVGELPLSIQVKLLRVLEVGEVRRLGASKSVPVDVRIVTATHRDLAAMVEDGSFREDLYWRLYVAPVDLPPLRRRVGDIVPLAEHFVRMSAPAGTTVTFSPAARARLEAHPWAGNARELRNVIQTALVSRRGGVITEEDLILRPPPRKKKGHDTIRVVGMTIADIEREAYRLCLERNGGDRTATMEELGVSRSTFFRKLSEFGLGGGD